MQEETRNKNSIYASTINAKSRGSSSKYVENGKMRKSSKNAKAHAGKRHG